MGYPDYERFSYSFQRAEIQADRDIFTAVTNVQFAQPTESGVVEGTKPYPLGDTEGKMGLGNGTLTFTNEAERIRFITSRGNGYRSKKWTLNWTLTAEGAPPVVYVCYGCRILDNPVSHGNGVESLGGDLMFSFINHTINGLYPHEL